MANEENSAIHLGGELQPYCIKVDVCSRVAKVLITQPPLTPLLSTKLCEGRIKYVLP